MLILSIIRKVNKMKYNSTTLRLEILLLLKHKGKNKHTEVI